VLTPGRKQPDRSTFHVATIALSFWNFRFGFTATVSRQGATYVDLFLKLPLLIPPRIAPIAFLRLNHPPLARARCFLFCRHVRFIAPVLESRMNSFVVFVELPNE
jgi:hypothetical protein